jgi:hypothetical protein
VGEWEVRISMKRGPGIGAPVLIQTTRSPAWRVLLASCMARAVLPMPGGP